MTDEELNGAIEDESQLAENEDEFIMIVKDLSRTFKKREHTVEAISNIDLKIKKGDFISLQGPSGSGKSTLLNLMGCLDKPTSGDIIIGASNVAKMSEKERDKIRGTQIGFVFQSFNLLPILNAIENVELPMEHGDLSKEEKREKAIGLLKLVDLEERGTHRPREMSQGEQQRVAIARALAIDPSIILADEPTGNLDSVTGEKIMGLLSSLNDNLGTTIVVVTHDDKMAKYAKKRVFLEDGRIIQDH